MLLKNKMYIFFTELMLSKTQDMLELYSNIVNTSFPLYVTTFPVLSIARIAIVVLLLGVFIKHTGDLTSFLHLLGAAYFFYYL